MASKLFVGNLPFTATENDLQDYFAQAGAVIAVNIMQDRATGRSRGFEGLFRELLASAGSGTGLSGGVRAGRAEVPRLSGVPSVLTSSPCKAVGVPSRESGGVWSLTSRRARVSLSRHPSRSAATMRDDSVRS